MTSPCEGSGRRLSIAKQLELSYKDILANPGKLRTFDQNSFTKENLSEPPFSSTWSSATDRCTSFTLKAVRLLDIRYPNIFRFQYHNIGRHKVTRCTKYRGSN